MTPHNRLQPFDYSLQLNATFLFSFDSIRMPKQPFTIEWWLKLSLQQTTDDGRVTMAKAI